MSLGVFFLILSQNNIPGSADSHAESIIWFQISLAFACLIILGVTESTGHLCSYVVLFLTAFMNSSDSLTDILDPVTFVLSLLMFINVSISGWCTEHDVVKAPLRPPCATSRVVLENLSINTAIPSVVNAAFAVGNPFGLILDISIPTPARLFSS